jgi:prepilin-type N-terminal cleavage/methylation domain-containing protein
MNALRSKIENLSKARAGFTIIELMIVVMILVILTSFAMPLLFKYRAQTIQSEARVLMSGVYTSQIAYYGENSIFSADPSILNFDPVEDTKFYKDWYIFTYPIGVNDHFIATCSTNLDTDDFRDVWELTDAERNPTNLFNDLNDTGP